MIKKHQTILHKFNKIFKLATILYKIFKLATQDILI